MNVIFYIALILVVLILVLRFKRGKSCGPRCQLPKASKQKKIKSYLDQKKEKEEAKKTYEARLKEIEKDDTKGRLNYLENYGKKEDGEKKK